MLYTDDDATRAMRLEEARDWLVECAHMVARVADEIVLVIGDRHEATGPLDRLVDASSEYLQRQEAS